MYEELVKRLRKAPIDWPDADLHYEAADAIEELSNCRAAEGGNMRLKPCVWRIHGEKTMSLTTAGEYYYNESFMPCMGEKCPAFNKSYISCMKDGCGFDLLPESPEEE